MVTKDTFFKQHLVCANENNYECDKNTKILVCKKGGGGECRMNRCIKIHKFGIKKTIKDSPS